MSTAHAMPLGPAVADLARLGQFPLQEIQGAETEPLYLEFSPFRTEKIIFNQLVGIFADRDLHRFRQRFHARCHIYAWPENVIYIFLDPNQGTDHRSGVDTNSAVPCFWVR